MSSESEEGDDALGLADAWLDGAADDDTVASVADSSSEVDRRRFADQLFLDSILQTTFKPVPGEELARRIDDVMARLGDSETMVSVQRPARAQTRRRWLASGMTIAAGIAGVVVLWMASEATLPTAQAAVEQASRQARQPVDRHYQIVVDLAAVKSLKADLYLRGADNLLAEVSGPLELSLLMGSNGKLAWVVPKIGPVIVAHDFEPIQNRLSDLSGLPLPLLKIANVLDALSNDYELEIAGQESLLEHGSATWRRVHATKRPGFRPLLPRYVDFWADPETGDIGKMVLDWSAQVENLAVNRIEFLLVDKHVRVPNWFEHSAHHDADRPILDLGKSFDRGGP